MNSSMEPCETVIRRYLQTMTQGDFAGTVACFSSGGVISSPTYGEVPVRAFYEKLFADTVKAEVDLQGVYRAPDDPKKWAAYFGYKWQRRDHSAMTADIVDIFEFEAASGLIASLKIIISVKPAG